MTMARLNGRRPSMNERKRCPKCGYWVEGNHYVDCPEVPGKHRISLMRAEINFMVRNRCALAPSRCVVNLKEAEDE
jgi:hypothetical protein